LAHRGRYAAAAFISGHGWIEFFRQHLDLILHLHTNTSAEEAFMRFRKRQPFFNVLLDTGLNLIDSLRDRLPDNVDDFRDRVRDTYGTASERVSRATGALRGEQESHLFGKGLAMVIGVGVGVGIGLLIAPANGDETLEDISDKVSEFGEKVRQRPNPQGATGTEGD
jgi:hypothetical protein